VANVGEHWRTLANTSVRQCYIQEACFDLLGKNQKMSILFRRKNSIKFICSIASKFIYLKIKLKSKLKKNASTKRTTRRTATTTATATS
jgi:hypothetical protein